MQDRYLYKAKRVDNGEWVIGFLRMVGYVYTITTFVIKNNYVVETGCYKVIPETVCRCTGLRDKNGVLIFEGDIYHHGDKNIRYVVVWNDTGFMGKQLGSNSYAGIEHWRDSIKIIGNRFDNPELLEVCK
jgi:hypothetical protein